MQSTHTHTHNITIYALYFSAACTHTEGVAFTAYTTGDQEADSGQTIQFPQTVINHGGAYEPGTSRFTAPSTGYYFIFINLNTSLWQDLCTVRINRVLDGTTVQVVDVSRGRTYRNKTFCNRTISVTSKLLDLCWSPDFCVVSKTSLRVLSLSCSMA